jgi:hypothetical protein
MEARILRAIRTGILAGDETFVEMLESATRRALKPLKPGRRKN